MRVINKGTAIALYGVYNNCNSSGGSLCVDGANGACRVNCMLIAWTGALVNSGNVFSGIKGSKLRVLKELVTIDLHDE